MSVPWNARRSNQSSLKKISSENSLPGLMLKLQYFDHLMCRDKPLEKTLTLGKIEGRRRMQDDRSEMVGWHHRFNGHEFEQTLRNGEDSDAWHAAVHEAAKSRTQQSD